ncbi:hypothetical protein C5S31_00100 [ANME-1 cluster archaeon GoMg2]|nr:hypothetical protein [ANME-1 cluster archaeon GoMg2]
MPITEVSKQLAQLSETEFTLYELADFTSEPWLLLSALNQKVLSKLQQQTATLGELFESIFQGVVTGVDDIYFLEHISDVEEDIRCDVVEVFSHREQRSIKIEKAILKPILKGEDVSRYSKPNFRYYCIYPYKLVGNKTIILEENELANNFPLALQYLRQHKTDLKKLRIKYKTNPNYWYSCHRGRSMVLFERERIITPEISFGCNMTLSPPGVYHNTKVYSILPAKSQPEHISYWMGLLNSKILWWFLSNTGYVLRGGFYVFKTNYLKPFPIHTIDFSNPEEVAQHDKLVALVDNMLELQKKHHEARMERDKELYERQIKIVDAQIDRLVYELYELTEEEVKVVEGDLK